MLRMPIVIRQRILLAIAARATTVWNRLLGHGVEMDRLHGGPGPHGLHYRQRLYRGRQHAQLLRLWQVGWRLRSRRQRYGLSRLFCGDSRNPVPQQLHPGIRRLRLWARLSRLCKRDLHGDAVGMLPVPTRRRGNELEFRANQAAACSWYRYFWKPAKTRPMSSALPRSATASAMELWYFSRSKGVSLSWSSSSTPTFT
jgi:hypothetical protein